MEEDFRGPYVRQGRYESSRQARSKAAEPSLRWKFDVCHVSLKWTQILVLFRHLYGRSLFGSVWPSWMIQKCSTGPKLSRRTFWTGKKQDGKPEKSRFIEIYADFGSFRGLFGAVRRLWSIRGAIWPEGHSFITSIRLEPVSYEIVINISITPTLLTLYCE